MQFGGKNLMSNEPRGLNNLIAFALMYPKIGKKLLSLNQRKEALAAYRGWDNFVPLSRRERQILDQSYGQNLRELAQNIRRQWRSSQN
jgi:hypothetical protein